MCVCVCVCVCVRFLYMRTYWCWWCHVIVFSIRMKWADVYGSTTTSRTATTTTAAASVQKPQSFGIFSHQVCKILSHWKNPLIFHFLFIPFIFHNSNLGLYSLSSKTSYHRISWSLKAAILDVIPIVSHWNLTGISTALLPRCLSNFRAIAKV